MYTVHHTGTRIKVLPLPITWIAPSPTSEQSAVQIKHLRDDHGYKFKEGTEKRGTISDFLTVLVQKSNYLRTMEDTQISN